MKRITETTLEAQRMALAGTAPRDAKLPRFAVRATSYYDIGLLGAKGGGDGDLEHAKSPRRDVQLTIGLGKT